MSKNKIIITIDGYSSCGKSTLARELAHKLNYKYIDSGAMYRAVTLFALRNNIIGKGFFNEQELIKKLPDIDIKLESDKDLNTLTILNNKNVEEDIRSIEVANYVSIISKNIEVREKMVDLQREMAKNKAIVMDGRDIGTVVFPDAELKLFLSADTLVRAKRRYKELTEKGIEVSLEQIKKNIEDRDRHDLSRKLSPLKKSKDAILIDNSNLTKAEQLKIAYDLAIKKINANACTNR